MSRVGLVRTPVRVCVCVTMNHPYPQIIPLIRQIYAGRFSHLIFFVPFERMPDDKDVITVYHGSYAAPGFINEAREHLADIDCDVFMFVHDDVILNPIICEENFRDYFPLGPMDAFIPGVGSPPEGIGDWIWHFGSIPKFFFPKSLLFSGGIEASNLGRYLPDAKLLRRKLEALDVPHKTYVRLDPERMPDVEAQPSRVLFHGMSRSLPSGASVGIADGTPAQVEAERLCLEAERALVRAMVATLNADEPGRVHDDIVDLPLPLVCTGFFSDFYLLPKAKLAEFAHYVGVSSAANLWPELMVATILYAICRTVWTAADLGLNFDGFVDRPEIEAFNDPRYMAIHPIKLSAYLVPERGGTFVAKLRAMGEARAWSPKEARLGSVGFGASAAEDFAGAGWHNAEDWGRWSSDPACTVKFVVPEGLEVKGLSLVLHAPLHETLLELTGTAQVNDGPEVLIDMRAPKIIAALVLPVDDLVVGPNVVTIRSDTMVTPNEIDPSFDDGRQIGFGLRVIEFS